MVIWLLLTADEGANLLKFLCIVGQVNNTEKRYPLSIQLVDLLKYLSVRQRVGPNNAPVKIVPTLSR